jgi:tetratricopeptide (TPR) repeat protein
MNRLARACSLAVLVAGCFAFQAAPAAAGPDEDARKHFDAGESYFKTSDYEGSLREFRTAYALSKRPLILLNLANVYERMSKLPEAVEMLKQYLDEDKNTKERATIELRIQNLQKRIDEAARSATEAGGSQPQSPAPSAAPPAPAPAASASAAPPPNRLPAYISLGVGGAAAIGAIVTGIVANGKYNDADAGCAKTPQGCSDSEVAPIKSMALASTILTGVAVLGVGAGAYFLLTAKPKSTQAASALVPAVSAGVLPRAGGITARWSF